MKNGFKFSLAVAPKPLPVSAPVIYRGNIFSAIAKAKGWGYDAVEIHVWDPDDIDPGAIKQCCNDNGMSVSVISTGMEYSINRLSLSDPDEGVRKELRTRLGRDIEIAEELNANLVIGCVRGNLPSENESRNTCLELFKNEMLLLSDNAAMHNVTVFLEAINFYVNNYLNTVKQTLDLIEEIGRDNIKLHIDTHHMAIEEHNMLEAVRLAGNRLGYVHFTENNRLYPGAGSTDFLSIMKTLRDIDYRGYIALEIIPFPDADTCASTGLRYLERLADIVDYRPVEL